MYGLIDSGRCYYEDFTEYHTNLGFQQIHYDQCYMHIVALYDDHHCKGSHKGDFIAFTYHVDDNKPIGDRITTPFGVGSPSFHTYRLWSV